MDYMFDAYVGYDVGEVDDIPKNTKEDIWLLGKKYSFDELELIRADVQTKLWCTYRRGFPGIGDLQLTSDKGFGCMLRCGQMVLATALTNLHLGRDWTWTSDTKDSTYLQIVSRFEDIKTAPYSIHQISAQGIDEGKKVSEWYSPNVIAQVLKKLVKFDDDFSKLVVHVALDHQLATDDIDDLCDVDDSFKPLLLIIPLRLGLDVINPIYIDALKKCFEFEASLGIIGGKPNQALYFIGYVGNEALYLDPHTVQRSGAIGNKENTNEIELDESFHQKYATRINFQQFDPSIAICFLCKTKSEYENLLINFQTQIIDTKMQSLFEITKSRPSPWISSSMSSRELENDLGLASGAGTEDFEELKKETTESDDEFEIID
ncbi:unnamed protein product [Diamesa serratosioi]